MYKWNKDGVNYFSCEKMVCESLEIKLPQFVAETVDEKAFFAILSSRREIPNDLQMTVSDVLSALKFIPTRKIDGFESLAQYPEMREQLQKLLEQSKAKQRVEEI